MDVFIAYASPERAWAAALRAACPTAGLDAFWDHDLLPGDEWDRELAARQRRARLTAVLVGPAFDAAYYLREEVATAIALGRAGVHRTVPVWLPGADRSPDRVPYGLRLKNAVDWTDAPTVAAQLARALGAPIAGAPPEPPGPDELDRDTRYRALLALLPGQVGELLSAERAPVDDFPSRYAPAAERALSVVQWVDDLPAARRRGFDARLRALLPRWFP